MTEVYKNISQCIYLSNFINSNKLWQSIFFLTNCYTRSRIKTLRPWHEMSFGQKEYGLSYERYRLRVIITTKNEQELIFWQEHISHFTDDTICCIFVGNFDSLTCKIICNIITWLRFLANPRPEFKIISVVLVSIQKQNSKKILCSVVPYFFPML